MDRSQFCWNGPRNVLRPTFPMAAPADAGFGAPLIWQGTRTFWLFTQLPPGVNNQNVLVRSEEHTSELQSHLNLVCRLLLEKKKKKKKKIKYKRTQMNLR